MGVPTPTPLMELGRSPAPLRGPPGPVVPPPVRSAGLLRCARPCPPSAPLGRCGLSPGAPPPPRAALPALAPGPFGAAGLGSAPLRRRRLALGPWRSRWLPGAAAGSGAAWPIGWAPAPVGAAPGLPRRVALRRARLRRAAALLRRPLRRPPRGVLAGGLLSLAAPSGRAALLPPPGLRPVPRRAGSPCPGPAGRPGYAVGRRASSLRGRLGRLRRPFSAAAPVVFGLPASKFRPYARGGQVRRLNLGTPGDYQTTPSPSRVKTSGLWPPLTAWARSGKTWVDGGPARAARLGPISTMEVREINDD